MTIFDSIKYPVPDDLDSATIAFTYLPEEIKEAYTNKIALSTSLIPYSAQIQLLRKVILDYNYDNL